MPTSVFQVIKKINSLNYSSNSLGISFRKLNSHVFITSVVKSKALSSRNVHSLFQPAYTLMKVRKNILLKQKLISTQSLKDNYINTLEKESGEMKDSKNDSTSKSRGSIDDWKSQPISLHGMNFLCFDRLHTSFQLDFLYCMNYPQSIKLSAEENELFIMTVKSFYDNMIQLNKLYNFYQACIDGGNLKTVEEYIYDVKFVHIEAKPFKMILNEIINTHNFKDFNKLCNYVMDHEVKLDAPLISLIFHCLESSDNCERYTFKKVKYFIEAMKAQNIQMRHVMEDDILLDNEPKLVKKMISEIDPSLLNYQCCIKYQIPATTARYKSRIMESLNKTISKANVESPLHNVITKEELAEAYKLQCEIENSYIINIKSIHSQSNKSSDPKDEALLVAWQKQWKKQIKSAVKQHKDFLGKDFVSQKRDAHSLYPYFSCLHDEDYEEILMKALQEMTLVSDVFSRPVYSMALQLGKDFLRKYNRRYSSTRLYSRFTQAYMKLCDWYLDHSANGGGYNPTVKWEELLKEGNLLNKTDLTPDGWPWILKRQLGDTLMNLIFNNVTIPVSINGQLTQRPAFLKVLRSRDGHNVYEILPCPELQQLKCAPQLLLLSDNLPMVCPPLPWLKHDYGGYLIERHHIIRSETSSKQLQLMDTNSTNMQPILDGLSQLGSTPWKINTDILDIISHIFTNGGSDELKIPLDIDSFSAIQEKAQPGLNYKENLTITLKNAKLQREQYSLWVECLMKLSIAEHYRNRTFWLPQTIDFRGRVYPTAAHLSHVTSDSFRSLMLFAKGKRLGRDGLRWLKIHVINLAGSHKREVLSERLRHCDENLDLIFDSADNPLNGQRWWTNASEMWQCLAACKELTNAMRSESPEDYISHLPIHQDGSCNGLQHYAALGRDTMGALSVNVKPSETPQDVYMQVLDIVARRVRSDVLNGRKAAIIVEPLLGRKVVKQTVMTSVYGVTRFGAVKQIKKQLTDDIEDTMDRHRVAAYLAELTLNALKEMFSNAKDIQNWLDRYATFITQVHNTEVSWYTPLGLPVVQPYVKQYITCAKSKRKVNGAKQRNGIAPNFIHSLDSTHMLLTALHCGECGITFAAIHDCYWTHAADVDRLNVICRNQFTELYSQPLLDDLKEYFESRFPIDKAATAAKLEVPALGSFDINEVKSSTYFFS